MGMASRTQFMALLFLVLFSLIAATLIIVTLFMHINLFHVFSSFLPISPNAIYRHS